eukprot:2197496-Alexandrium_andersonii.AAC.1
MARRRSGASRVRRCAPGMPRFVQRPGCPEQQQLQQQQQRQQQKQQKSNHSNIDNNKELQL